MIIEGKVSVKAALLNNKRKINVIYFDEKKHDKEVHFIEQRAKGNNIPCKRVSKDEISNIAKGKTHGGIVADVEERMYQDLNECFKDEVPFISLVEGVEDPFNLGYIMRSLYSAGCNTLIIRERDWSFVEDQILKSSAGASEYMNLVCYKDMSEAVKICKDHGLYVYAAMRKDAITYFEADFKQPILLCIGGEMRGLSSGLLKEVDQNIYIPYANDFRNALNAAGASAALGFEVVRQRQK